MGDDPKDELVESGGFKIAGHRRVAYGPVVAVHEFECFQCLKWKLPAGKTALKRMEEITIEGLLIDGEPATTDDFITDIRIHYNERDERRFFFRASARRARLAKNKEGEENDRQG